MSAAPHIGIDARCLGRRGVGRYLKNLCGAMAQAEPGWRFTLFLGPKSERGALPKAPNVAWVELEGHPARLEQASIPAAAQALGCHVLHYPENSGALKPGLPMVLTMHDSMWRRPIRLSIHRPSLGQRLQDLYRKWVCPRAARRADLVLTITEHSRRDLIQCLGLAAEKVRVTSEGLDPSMARPLAPALARTLRQRLGVKGPYVLASGASDLRKNVEALMRAFKLAKARTPGLAKADLVVTSLGAQELATTRYHATAQALGIAGQVRYVGYVSDEQLKALYQGALCFAFPSLWEGFGLPVLEAYSLGCPVLASGTTGLVETAGRGAVLCDPASVESIATGLAQACDPKRRSALVTAGRRELRRFSWARAARKTLEAYQAVLADRGLR